MNKACGCYYSIIMKKASSKSKTYSRIFLISLLLSLVQVSQMYSLARSEGVPQDNFRTSDDWVKYRVEYSMSFSASSFTNPVLRMWIFRINNFTTQVNPNYANMQLSELKDMEITGADTQEFCESDVHGNSIFYIDRIFRSSDSNNTFSAYFDYEVTLYRTRWNYTGSDVGQILPELPEYKFTKAVPYIESNESVLIELSNNITAGITDTKQKVKAIFDYVKGNLEYKILDKPLGALKAYNLGYGDCSEFSSLTVALLRAQGIPARKALGITIMDPDEKENVPLYRPTKNQKIVYETIPGHAWIQYFLPNVGWVTADPTWGSVVTTSNDYGSFFVEQDYLHMTLSVGDYYGEGITPKLDIISGSEWAYQELGLGPFILTSAKESDSSFTVDYQFTVLDFSISRNINWASLLLLAIMVICVIGLIIYAFKPRHRNKNHY